MLEENVNEQLVIGLQGKRLTDGERQWLRRRPPRGVILFARNVESPEQVAALLSEVRDCTGQASWAAIDEEGGRVNRMPWLPFSGRRHAGDYGVLFADDPEVARRAVRDDNRQVGEALAAMGFTHNCAPVLDLFHAGADAIIGRRAYGETVEVVAELGAACLQGLRDAGIEGVGKHFPGHGRANADSHVAVPEVDADLSTLLDEAVTFKALIGAGLSHVMTAHVIYTQVETRVATLSPYWLRTVLRDRFGFGGCIWSDDLCMKGVGDDVVSAAAEAQTAGCDVLLVCEPPGVGEIYRALGEA